jgi:hypothetical protein
MSTETLHITVANQPNLSGTCPAPFDTLNNYTCPLGTFQITPAANGGFQHSGNGSTLNESGKFEITVGSDYGTVTFDGHFIVQGGKGGGNCRWTGTHPPRNQGGADTWTSETTTPAPKPHRRDAKAKGQTS